jgi:hypothetical protein
MVGTAMRDEDFEYFVSKFGEATHHVDVPGEKIHKWHGQLPSQLLGYWHDEGGADTQMDCSGQLIRMITKIL